MDIKQTISELTEQLKKSTNPKDKERIKEQILALKVYRDSYTNHPEIMERLS